MGIISLNLLPEPNYHIIGHRGAPKHAPENTLASFKIAADLGLNWIEFDVQLTKDDELIIFHDDYLERTSNGTGLVIEQSLKALQMLDIGSWFSPQFQDQKIPTLIETIPLLKTWGLTPNIEIKCRKNQNPLLTKKLAYKLADCLLKHWPQANTRSLPLVTSFDHSALFYYRERLLMSSILPAPIGFLVDDIEAHHIILVNNTLNSVLHCKQDQVTPERVHELTQQGIPLFVYTINDKKLGLTYLQAGAIAIFTDMPDIFIPPSPKSYGE